MHLCTVETIRRREDSEAGGDPLLLSSQTIELFVVSCKTTQEFGDKGAH